LLIIKPDLFAYFVVDLPIALNIIGYYTASRLRTPDKTRRLKTSRGKIERDCASHIKSGSILGRKIQPTVNNHRATGINIINLR
jgi:hypothetical protein